MASVHGVVTDMSATPDGSAELQFVARLRAGDECAFEALVREHGPRMLAVARRLLRSESDAGEAVQEAFIAAFRGIARFEGGARLSTWLHRIVVNAALMRIRTRDRRGEESIESLLPSFLEDGHQAHPSCPWPESADHALEREESRDLVRRCIDRLPDNYRTVLVLRDIEELDTEETARALGTNANVVKIRLHRARQALRTLLEQQMRGPSA